MRRWHVAIMGRRQLSATEHIAIMGRRQLSATEHRYMNSKPEAIERPRFTIRARIQRPQKDLSDPGVDLSDPGVDLSDPGVDLSDPGIGLSVRDSCNPRIM